MIEPIKNYLQTLQTQIVSALTPHDDPFIIDKWVQDIGHGQACILRNGKIFDSAGVNFSHVQGSYLPPSATLRRPDLNHAPFEAIGLSLVIHPKNPFVPTTHANLRFFVATPPDQAPIWWFGGGYDLTPYYGFIEDCVHWHQCAQAACDPFGSDRYATYKQACDDYFYLKHRSEARGIGGLFFDDLTGDLTDCFDLVRSIGDSFLKAYMPIVIERKDTPFTQEQQDFQRMRRGRYVEFNLLYDRGTLFGLQSGGRIESIFMSLPPQVNWTYDWQATPGSLEHQLVEFYLQPKDWLAPVYAKYQV